MMRGVALINAVTIVAEIGDFARFSNPRQLMAYVGLVPSEASTGDSVRRGGITKAGNNQVRRALIEAAWTYRMQARVSESCKTALTSCRKKSATSHGRRKSNCAHAIAGWLPRVSRGWLSRQRSLAR
jgi:transposase